MCWFKKPKPPVVEPPPVTPPPEPPLTIPHPEEPPHNQILTVDAVFDDWLVLYQVPEMEYSYWRNQIDIKVYDQWDAKVLSWNVSPETPAFAFEQDKKRHLYCLNKWFNPGVIAHEQAHNSYALLTNDQKTAFGNELFRLENTDPYITLLWKTKRPSWGDYVVEAHAELFRYLGEKMPESLKQFYPRLF